MRYCGICGRERDETAQFCGTCGSEFRDQAEAEAADEPAAVPVSTTGPEITTEPETTAEPATTTGPTSTTDSPPPADAAGWTPPAAADPWTPPVETAGWGQPPDATRWEPPADSTRWDAPAPVTRWDPPVDATRAEPVPDAARLGPPDPNPDPAAAPDPFASWFKQDAGPEAAGAGSTESWDQPTQTVRTTSGQPPTGYPPPTDQPVPPYPPAAPGPTPPQPGGYQPAGYQAAGYPPAGYPPNGYPPTGPPPNRGRRGGLIILFAVVLVLIGGAAYGLASTLGNHPAASPEPTSTVRASTPAASTPANTATASAASSASAGTSGSPTASPSPTATATPSPALSLIAVGPGVTSAALPQVETLFSRYFQGINKHDYQEYASALNPQQQAAQPASTFNSGYATTTDSGMTLTALTPAGPGGYTATVAFTSHQDPADSVDKSACNTWTLTYHLVPSGAGYLIGPAPAGAAQPTYSNC